MKPAKIVLRNGRDRATARKWLDACPLHYTLWFKPPTRSNLQSKRMWALLDDVAAQKEWAGKKRSSDEFKDLFSASLRGQELVPNLDGNGFVAFGARTSEFSPEEMSDMITLIEAWGATNGVVFTDPQQALAGDAPSETRAEPDRVDGNRGPGSARGSSGGGE